MRRIVLAVTFAAALVAVSVGLVAAFARGSKPPLTGVALDRRVPLVGLLDEHGRRTTLADFRGKVVVLAPTLTLCHEVCPITSGALEEIQYDVSRAGLSRRVAIVEVSVDPWRDSPARLRAYREATGVGFQLLTGTKDQLRRFWRAFGVGFFPTGHGRSFDVAHTDGVFFVDADGRLRIAIVGMPNVHGRLAERLKRLLGTRGLGNLRHPAAGWTVAQALADLERLTGKTIPERRLP